MTNREALPSLADRVSALSGPCRETDAVIAATCRLGADNWSWADGYPEWEGRSDGRVYLEQGGPSFAAPSYTASIDSAMSLAGDDALSELLNEAMEETGQCGWTIGDYKGALTRQFVAASLRALAQPTVPQP